MSLNLGCHIAIGESDWPEQDFVLDASHIAQ